MSKKQEFTNMVNVLLDFWIESGKETESFKDALVYFEGFNSTKDSKKIEFTENGKSILVYMQNNKEDKNNLFKASDIAEGLFVSSRSVSGAIRKLVTDGYVEKIGESPITYTLTSVGENFKFED